MSHRAGRRVFARVLLGGYLALLLWNAWVHSVVIDESGHIAAGIVQWQYQDAWGLYRVNPPLPRLVGTYPLVLFRLASIREPKVPASPAMRTDMLVAEALLEQNAARWHGVLFTARLGMLGFALAGLWACYRLGRLLYGPVGGQLAAWLWASSPMVLGHGAFVATDVPAAAMAAVACYAVVRAMRGGGYRAWLLAGLALGAALSCKFTLLVFPPLLLLAAVVADIRSRAAARASWGRTKGALLACAVALLVVNAVYRFAGTLRPLGKYEFVSCLFSGKEEPFGIQTGNRFRRWGLGWLPVPLPAEFVQGIDYQRWEFERGYPSYLRGEWKQDGGWWYYYLYALGVKTPLGTLGLWALGLVSLLWPATWRRGERFPLILGLAVLVLVSSQTGFNHHLRYLLPAYPFLFLLGARLGHPRLWKLPWLRVAVWGCVVWSAVWVAQVSPHWLSFFNLAAGGPENGPAHLLDSNIDWGQDLYFLREWYRRHPDRKPLYLAYFGMDDPRRVGIRYHLPPQELRPGWYVVSVNPLYGLTHFVRDPQGRFVPLPREYFAPLRRFRPVERIGYSLYVFHIRPEDVAGRDARRTPASP